MLQRYTGAIILGTIKVMQGYFTRKQPVQMFEQGCATITDSHLIKAGSTAPIVLEAVYNGK